MTGTHYSIQLGHNKIRLGTQYNGDTKIQLGHNIVCNWDTLKYDRDTLVHTMQLGYNKIQPGHIIIQLRR